MRAYYDPDARGALLDTPEPRARMPIEFDDMPTFSRILTAIAIAGLLVLVLDGCVYRQTISQGNVMEQEDIDKLEVGMTRNQVRFLLGTPLIDDPFHRDRWDYVYYLKLGRNDAVAKRWLSVFFDGDVVSEIRRDQELNPDL